MAYDLGDVVPLAVTVTDAGGTPVNAGSMALTITLPDDSTVTVSPIPPTSPGTYTYDYATTQAGRHLVRWVATGVYANAYSDVFDVRDQTPVAIVSLADAKKQLGLAASDTADDEKLRGFITGASLAVERHLGRIVARRTFTERRTARGGRVLLSHVPVLTVTSAVSADGATTWTADDLDVDTDSGLVTARPGAAPLVGDIDFIYTAGLRIVPDDYQLATLIITQHLWETQRGRMGAVPGGSDEPEYLSGRGFALPRRALELLDAPLPGVA
ncbi:hypothetical protein ACFOOM_12120 [Streptomyces echinoruber]|uniref:Ig-like domain repeat protein n=1 Tax=Streptomyces echinoruber TaxID=68898 RepID=A0A918VJ51_9ACTN|nr:hypothetical protein [Streptomyces echinoruber]GHA01491.1 hypothetical protein GCM10010389_46080 [Streptomyces echinoruber]